MARKFNTKSIADASLPGTKIQTGTIPAAAINSVRIANVAYTSNVWSVLDDTAVSTAGGFIRITGAGFEPNSTVTVESVPASSVTYVSSTELRAQIPAAAAGSRHLYVVNSDGAVAIRVNGVNYSAEPTWSTTSPLANGQDSDPISVQLSASSNSTITYSLQTGSSLPAGLTLAANGLISGTVTGLTVETTYNFTVEATDLELQNTPRAFSITITVNDQHFEYVTTLLSASTPTTNPFATDASTNNFAVTVNGDTRPSNFGPYTPGYYSNYFDGTSDSLTYTGGSSLNFGTGDFTIETWAYLTNTGTFSAFLRPDDTGAFSEWGYDFSTGQLKFDARNAAIVATTTTMPTNQWVHVAVSRTGTSLRQFINGTQVGSTTTNSTNFGSTTGSIRIGGSSFSGSHSVNGYLSNFRVVVGTAVYTSNFTPSTTPLTAIANTTLLTCQSNRFIDNSTNNFTVTRNGDTLVSGFDPFLPNSSYSSYGSTYFDGTGDWLEIPYNSAFDLSTGNWTVECWWYPTAVADQNIVMVNYVGGDGYAQARITATSGGAFRILSASGAVTWINTTAIGSYTTGQWYHLAYVRNGSTFSLYLNGVLAGSYSSASNLQSASGVSAVGRNSSTTGGATFQYTSGYVTDVRIVKGTAVYTTAFTPPATPLTAIANTSLLTCQTNQPVNNSQFVDSSTNNFLITRNGNTTQGAFTPYAGTWSNHFNGSTDYFSMSDNNAFQYGAGDFALECWVYPTATLSGNYIVSQWFTGDKGVILGIISGSLAFYYSTTGSNDLGLISATNPTLNQWSHLLACRTGNTISLYLNGTRVATTTETGTLFNSSTTIGIATHVQGLGSALWPGYISNLRSIAGSNPYNAAQTTITVPTAPLTAVTNTRLLICADNRFVDDSMNRFTLTSAGSPSAQRFSPFGPQLQQTPTSYSVYFDGSGDYLTLPSNSAFAFATGAYTIESWIYAVESPAYAVIFTAGVNGIQFGINASGYISIAQTNVDFELNSATTMPLNQWNHVVVCRNGANITSIFLNGSRIASGTVATNYSNGTAYINYNPYNANDFTGYFSNLRVVKGTAVYDPTQTTLTVPTAPLTAIANTSLLTCQSTTIIDNSTNAFAITVNGNSQPLPQNPFGYTNPASTAYTPATYGGSAYFDGNGDWLEIPYNSAFNLSTGNWTIECWWYPTVVANQTLVMINYVGGDGYAHARIAPTSGGAFAILSASGATTWINTTAIGSYTTGQWYHLAYVRNGSTFSLYVNGTLAGSYTSASNLQSASGVSAVGRTSATISSFNYTSGYVTDVRVTKGTAIYTGAFVPPAAPLAPIQNSVLLLNNASAAIYDSSMMNDFETVGDARINTSIVKFAGKPSIAFDGTGDNLLIPTTPVINFGTGNFTVELWAYFNSLSSNRLLIDRWASGNAASWQLYWRSTGTSLTFLVGGSTILLQDPNASRITTGQWYHIAVTRSGTTARMFINGTQVASASDSTSLSNSLPLSIGSQHSTSTNYFDGYMSDLRITRGVARYTANFTPTTSPFMAK